MSEDFKYKYHPSEVQKILNEISTSQDIRSKLGFEKRPLNLTKEDIFNNSSIVTVKDIYDFIGDILGKDIIDWNQLYNNLSPLDKNIIKEISNVSTKDGRLDVLNDNIMIIDKLSNILDLLPRWYKINFRLFGVCKPDEFCEKIVEPEFKIFDNLIPILNKELEAQKKIFSSFSIGEVLSGPIIKERLRDIYQSIGFEKTPKIKDLYELFDIHTTRKGYLLFTKKLILN